MRPLATRNSLTQSADEDSLPVSDIPSEAVNEPAEARVVLAESGIIEQAVAVNTSYRAANRIGRLHAMIPFRRYEQRNFDEPLEKKSLVAKQVALS